MEAALKNFTKKKLDDLEKKLLKFCEQTLDKAIQSRFDAPGAHNFTGNLVNSIVVGLWREGRLVQGFLPGSKNNVEMVKRKKMTAGVWYRYKIDYDTVPNTVFYGTVTTNQGKGRQDALNFLETFKPDPKAAFHIVVAYTTEYANWVETMRGTTGFMKTVEWIKMNTETLIK